MNHIFLEGDSCFMLDKVEDSSISLAITSPPYNIGKDYEKGERKSLDRYLDDLRPIVDKICNKIKDDGHICWQVGNYVQNSNVFPLDIYFYHMFIENGFKLRNRIIWHFNFGLHSQKRFSGRYETILWFSKSDDYYFNVDPVRIPQIYPGKRHSASKSKNAGLLSGNPNGKNPSDFWVFSAENEFRNNPIWDFPNVKANHPEKTLHPCQFPSELVERCVLALTKQNDTILDPFLGAGTSTIAAEKHNRICIGIDKEKSYLKLAQKRLKQFRDGSLKTRPIGKPIMQPKDAGKVADYPIEWRGAAE